MGAYRMLLAYLVVFSHVHPYILGNDFGYHLGVVAVVSFLLLSGFVMTALIEKYYLSIGQVVPFYFDRLLRIGPQFIVYSILTLFAAHEFGLRHQWMLSPPPWNETIPQLLIFPLNFYWLFPRMIIPQAWSLGLEAAFYLVFPFVLIFRVRGAAAVVSFGIFFLAYTGVLDTDLWGYRYLPGTLFIFICGSWLASANTAWERLAPFAMVAVATLLLIWTYLHPSFALGNNRSVLAGLILGVPAVARIRLLADNPSWLSDKAGDLSYGVFLNHLLIIGAISSFANVHVDRMALGTQIGYVTMICASASALSFVSFRLVEAPLIAWRRSLRRRTRSCAATAISSVPAQRP